MVIGLGAMGTATCYHLARRGERVLGVEQFGLGHDQGSSGGSTRIIRRAYFEHPDYVPLLNKIYELWSAVEQDTGRTLVHRVGLLLAGDPKCTILSGVRRAADEHNLQVDDILPNELPRRFPQFSFQPQWEGLFEPDAGYLLVDDCIRAHAELAVSHGAELRFNERVTNWTATASGVRVDLEDGSHEAARLAICCGAWSAGLLHDIGAPLEIRRKVVLWFDPGGAGFDAKHGCPIFGFDTADGFFYGFPAIDGDGVKIGNHTGGETIDNISKLDRQLRPADETPIRRFAAKHLPGLGDQINRHSVCMYSMTPDEHFVIDHHPLFQSRESGQRVAFAAGFSGHGFKFAPLVGSILADLLLDGTTAEPIEFLRLNRPALLAGGDSASTAL